MPAAGRIGPGVILGRARRPARAAAGGARLRVEHEPVERGGGDHAEDRRGGRLGVEAGAKVAFGHAAAQHPGEDLDVLLAQRAQAVAPVAVGAPHLRHHKLGEGLVVLDVGELCVDQGAQRGVAVRRAFYLAAKRLGEPSQAVVEQRRDQLRLAAEVVVHGAFGDPGTLDDLVHRRAGVAAFAEQLDGGQKEAVERVCVGSWHLLAPLLGCAGCAGDAAARRPRVVAARVASRGQCCALCGHCIVTTGLRRSIVHMRRRCAVSIVPTTPRPAKPSSTSVSMASARRSPPEIA
jgi:hypothetical protein